MYIKYIFYSPKKAANTSKILSKAPNTVIFQPQFTLHSLVKKKVINVTNPMTIGSRFKILAAITAFSNTPD